MWKGEHKINENNLEIIELFNDSKEFSTIIYLHGATITSWKHLNIERLFVSSIAIFNGIKAIRGGIPVVWPQFGQPNTKMPQHGFLRNSLWNLHEITPSDDNVSATFIIHSNENTLQVWPHPFRVTYTVTLSEQGLTCNLKTFNTGESPFQCHALLHTYFSIPHIQEVSFSGYYGHSYVDKTRNNQLLQHDSDLPFEINEEVDRVYSSQDPSNPIPDVVIYSNTLNKPLMTIHKQSQIISQFDGITPIPCDCVLWNPWIEKSKSLNDMDDDGYLKFVCVEPGVVNDYVTIQPNQALNLIQNLIPSE